MSKLTVKKENGRFYLKSGNNWTPLGEHLKNLADVKKSFYCEDIELVTAAGQPYQTIEVLGYDGYNLTLKEGAIESKIYFPLADEKQITDYLVNQGKSQGFNQVVIKFLKPIKEPEPIKEPIISKD